MGESKKTVFVTGAAGGIGKETIRRYLAGGYSVAAADLNRESLDELERDMRAEFPDADLITMILDQSSEDSVKNAVEAVRRWTVTLTTLAVVAGTLQSDGVPVTRLETSEFERVHSVNLKGPFLLAKYFTPIIAADGSGSIVMVASYWGRQAHPLYAAYCSSKAGLISLTQVLAHELSGEQIRVNGVAPGNMNTAMHQKHLRDEATERGISYETMRDSHWSTIPLGYAGPASAIADAIFFLSSSDSDYITGATLDVNGGVVMT